MEVLQRKASEWNCSLDSRQFAINMDDEDPLKEFREKFYYPKKKDIPKVDMSPEEDPEAKCIYLCGHSLGLQPKTTKSHIQRTLDDWAALGVTGHQCGHLPFAHCDNPPKEMMAKLVGARPNEVVLMNGLTINLHILLASFYKPTSQRHKILIEEYAFPSDMHAAISQINLHGYKPEESLLLLKPREGEYLLRKEDIINIIEENGNSIAVILLPGVQFYTGQVLDVKRITEVGHKKNCIVAFDLAHTVGNVDVKLHEWDVDFAAWCTYKYLNSSPGGIAGIYVHERFTKEKRQDFPLLRGWWGTKPSARFSLTTEFQHNDGADMFKISNPPPLLLSPLIASLEIVEEATPERMRAKQLLLTSYLEALIHNLISKDQMQDGSKIQIITSSRPEERGSQLSILLTKISGDAATELQRRGVVFDMRQSLLRIAAIPLYNSYLDVYKFAEILKDVVCEKPKGTKAPVSGF